MPYMYALIGTATAGLAVCVAVFIYKKVLVYVFNNNITFVHLLKVLGVGI